MKAGTRYLLVVSSSSETVQQLQRIFALERDYSIQFTDKCNEALHLSARSGQEISLILVDRTVSDGSSLETIRKLAATSPAVPIIAIAEQTAVSYVREALLSGARAFITLPLHDSDVINTVNQLLQMEQTRRARQEKAGPTVSQKQCQIVTLMSPKGGVGTTTLSVNLAVAVKEHTKGRVILIDGHGSLGDLVSAMNLQAQFSHGDLLHSDGQLDAEMVQGVLNTHTSGVEVLTSSDQLEDADFFTPEILEQIVFQLKPFADYIFIDAGSVFEEQTAIALSVASQVLLITTPEITALRRCSLFLRAAEQNDFPKSKFQLIVNREGIPGGLSVDDVKQNLNMEVAVAIPDDSGFVTYSLNRGIPFVTSNTRSAIARRLLKFVERLAPISKPEVEPVPQNLFGRLTTILKSHPA